MRNIRGRTIAPSRALIRRRLGPTRGLIEGSPGLQDDPAAVGWDEDRAAPARSLDPIVGGQHNATRDDVADDRLHLKHRKVPAEAVLRTASPGQPRPRLCRSTDESLRSEAVWGRVEIGPVVQKVRAGRELYLRRVAPLTDPDGRRDNPWDR